ncbi:hypothetical protein [Halosegnis marinus]|uniref:DUF7974 domain-containing protein n=1 Tax=Halosegnis marinus TaxID=3034023 RepID=A0ABD5ZQN1_9EURY|nr:hypothetical protein [Halosegnis sp. DT85]
MRRIYESNALDRDDDDPFAPNEREPRVRPTAMRSLPAERVSRLVVPHRLRCRAVRATVSTPADTFARGEQVPFFVEFRNTLPFPVSLRTRSPLLWSWAVDGHREADTTAEDPGGDAGRLTFARGERKRFHRTWSGLFRVTPTEWEEPAPGEYTLSAGINVADPFREAVTAATTVRIE